MISCRDAAALMVAREDRPLPLHSRVLLHLHLLACKACPPFERQLLTLRNAMRQWRNYHDE
ncbi:MAG: zf-HC2 domain-containing protein [Ramlibacter sp.]|nr:zf-HC2 domain-containing protein [Ramlibacter sp.]